MRPDLVVKIGGALLKHPDVLARTLDAIADAAPGRPIVVVPGGGPFADAVRALDASLHLPATAAHWMAILGMDQYAYVLAAQLPGAILVRSPRDVGGALTSGRVPVLA